MARRQTKRQVKRTSSKGRKRKGGAKLPLLKFKWFFFALAVVLLVLVFRSLVATRDYRTYSRKMAREVISQLSHRKGWELVNTQWMDRRDGRTRWVTAVTVWQTREQPLRALKRVSRSFPGLKVQRKGKAWACYGRGVEILRFILLAPPPAKPPPTRVRKKEKPKEVASAARAKVAIVIDDMGYRMDLARAFLALPWPITLSIIPFSRKAGEVARLTHERGHEVMLHLPMDANGGGEAIERLESRTPGMLLVSMSNNELRRLVRKEIAQVPYAYGANNHMGSKFTRNRRCMRVVLEELKARGYFFLDSLTDRRSVACSEARRLGVKCFRRDIFLDNSKDQAYILHQMDALARLALRRGYAIAIGHPSMATLAALKKGLPKLEKKGIKVVPLSEL